MYKSFWRQNWLAVSLLAAWVQSCTVQSPSDAPVSDVTSALRKTGTLSTKPKTMYILGMSDGLVATAQTTSSEDDDLTTAITQYAAIDGEVDAIERLSPFESYVDHHPGSGWNATLHASLGFAYYEAGHFSKAIRAWELAWAEGEDATHPLARGVVDRAIGELARMHSRLGRVEDVEDILAQVKDREVLGSATEALTNAKEAAYQMRHNPGIAFLCGPQALKNMLLSLQRPGRFVDVLDRQRSGPDGFSLSEVSRMASRWASHRMVFRTTDQDIPVPSVIHWKLNHYAAVVAERDGKYYLKDPTFGNDLVVAKAAIDSEASGYFLVPEASSSGRSPFVSPGDRSWRPVSADEASRVRGMGYVTTHESGHTRPTDQRQNGPQPPTPQQPGEPLSPEANPTDPQCVGMCEPDVHLMQLSLNLTDTPVGYRPQYGPAIYARVAYNQREDDEPASPPFTNLGPKWSLALISYIEDSPTDSGTTVTRKVAGGGRVSYQNATTVNINGIATAVFPMERQTGAVLRRIPATGGASTTYTLTQRNGAKLTFGYSDGATSGVRRLFLSKIEEPQGAAATLSYTRSGATVRLVAVGDAVGRQTTLEYGNAAYPLRVTRVRDPFNRSAAFTYDPQARLETITDSIGIVSRFAYVGTSSNVSSLVTPYGTTVFDYGQDGQRRWLSVTKPTGHTERYEFHYDNILAKEADAREPVGYGGTVQWLRYRNTFYWNAKSYAEYGADPTKAVIYHWLHVSPSVNQIAGSLESIKRPLESRIFYSYPGATASPAVYQGLHDGPSLISRRRPYLPEQGADDVFSRTFDTFGNVLTETDAMGRVTTHIYSSDGTDEIKRGQRVAIGDGSSPSEPNIAYFVNRTYQSHKVSTHTGLDGQQWFYAYDSFGMLKTITNPLNQVTTFSYDNLHRLKTVTNANGVVSTTVEYPCDYDGVWNCDLPQMITRSNGALTRYSYDRMDRVTGKSQGQRVNGGFAFYSGQEYTYKNLHLESFTDGRSRVQSFSVDENRRLRCVAIPALASSTNPAGNQTCFQYYPDGSLRAIGDGSSNDRSFEVDLQGRPTRKVYLATNKETKWNYDSSGRLTNINSARVQPSGGYYAADATQLVFYNGDGRLSSNYQVVPDVSTVYVWDTWWPRLKRIDDPKTYSRDYTYYPANTLGAGKVKTDGVAQYAYDALGRMIERRFLVDLEIDPGELAIERWSYDAIGRVVTHKTALGVFSYFYVGQTGLVSSVNLDGSPYVTKYYRSDPHDTLPSSIMYSTNPSNWFMVSRAGIDDNIRNFKHYLGNSFWNWDYQYDAAGRLLTAARKPPGSTTAGTYSYVFDGHGNMTVAGNFGTYAYNGNDEIVSSGYAYDGAGAVDYSPEYTVMKDIQGQVKQTIDWTSAPPGQSPEAQYAYSYDAAGRPAISQDLVLGRQERLLWCEGGVLCGKQRWTGTAWRQTERYYPEGQYNQIEGKGLLTARDHLGTTRAIARVGDRGVLAAYEYTPYGQMWSIDGGLSPGQRVAIMFAGLYQERTGGPLHISQSRFYDSKVGRFISRDPIGERGGANLYAYAAGDPLRFSDPSGLAPFCNGSSRPILVGGGVGAGQGHDGGFGQGDVPPGACVNPDTPLSTPEGPVSDVDVVDWNGDGWVQPPQNWRDSWGLGGEKIWGSDTGPVCMAIDNPFPSWPNSDPIIPIPWGWQ